MGQTAQIVKEMIQLHFQTVPTVKDLNFFF